MSAHKNMQEGYAYRKRQQDHDHKLIERYQMVMALIATHENELHPDYKYLKDLHKRRDQIRTQLKYCGIL